MADLGAPLDETAMPRFWGESRENARSLRAWLLEALEVATSEARCFDCRKPGVVLAAPDGNWQVWRWHCEDHRREAWGTVLSERDVEALLPVLVALAPKETDDA